MGHGVIKVEVNSDEDGMRVDRWFKLHYPMLAHSMLNKILRKGDVRVDGKRVKANSRLEAGQEIRVPPMPDEFLQEKKGNPPYKLSKDEERWLKDCILFEDDAIYVMNKPAGLATQGGTKSNHQNLDDMMKAYSAKQGSEEDAGDAKLVHRLDKETSGIQIFAKTRKTAQALAKQFQRKQIDKTYLAITRGVPELEEGEINAPLFRRKDKVVVDEEEGKKALTAFRVLDKAGHKLALIEAKPVTGRTHQIRVHLSLMGTPIIGDDKYNENFIADEEEFFNNENSRLYLHAFSVNFQHPLTGKHMNIKAPLPAHFDAFFEKIGFEIAF